jgi:hypothetical protein
MKDRDKIIYPSGKTCCIFHESNLTTSNPNLGVQSCQRLIDPKKAIKGQINSKDQLIQNKLSRNKLMAENTHI